jgi:hypothetical protein
MVTSPDYRHVRPARSPSSPSTTVNAHILPWVRDCRTNRLAGRRRPVIAYHLRVASLPVLGSAGYNTTITAWKTSQGEFLRSSTTGNVRRPLLRCQCIECVEVRPLAPKQQVVEVAAAVSGSRQQISPSRIAQCARAPHVRDVLWDCGQDLKTCPLRETRLATMFAHVGQYRALAPHHIDEIRTPSARAKLRAEGRLVNTSEMSCV